MRALGWAPIQCDWYLNRMGIFGHRERHVHKENDVTTQEECHLSAKGRLRLSNAGKEAWKSLSRNLQKEPILLMP